MNRMKDRYIKEIVPVLMAEFGYSNINQVPKLQKVVLNAGVGRATADSKYLEAASQSLAIIGGQAPVTTKAKQSVASFKLREGNAIGAMATLRGERMYAFLDRLVAVTLPRIRDFRGIGATGFDPQGNYSLGISDHTIFPEIAYDDASKSHGLQVNVVTTAKTAAEGKRLLELFGFPFRKETD